MSGSSSSHLRTESELYGHTWPGTTRAITQNCPSLKAKCTRTPICSAVMFVVDSMSRPEGKHFLHHDKGNLKRRKRQGLHAWTAVCVCAETRCPPAPREALRGLKWSDPSQALNGCLSRLKVTGDKGSKS